ncbi:response regulator transcription factor [Bacillus weihaiensis]|uniref:DNA-binding response regulator n=1 Tax=Bacillus weihaiensis TaxID=1547283 RepID=A0A1L3MMA9_9BACI|nr:response regulator [Bacillus weihaiensis]APH03488.1 DNA-binding response regulator [Bacillus weihaiensis]
MKLLIVDDEYLEIEQIRFLLTKHFPLWEIFDAEDASMALKILEKEQINLAFLDIHMPGESGLELAKKLKQRKMETELIFVTAYQDFDYVKQALHLHALDYLVKPVIETELIDVMKKYVATHQQAVAKSQAVQHVLSKIETSFQEKLNLTEIANEIPVNPTYLSRKFSEEIGKTFQEYLTLYRIQKAKGLLKKHPDWSMTMIAEHSGFNSQHHFSNTFKKMEQITPSHYKETLR